MRGLQLLKGFVMRVISEQVQHQAFNGSSSDAYNNTVPSWGSPVPVDVYAFDPGGSAEVLVGGHVQRVVTTPQLFMPSTVVFNPLDRVTVRGVLYEVDGETAQWKHPDGSQRGSTVKLRRVTG